MEREELLQQVQTEIEAQGKQLSPSLSTISINGELDDELENITDDEEQNKKVVTRLAKRLLRMDGNIHKNVSDEIKKNRPKPEPPKPEPPKKPEEGDDVPEWGKALLQKIEGMEKANQSRAAKEVKDATLAEVKKGLTAKFKKADVQVNDYILGQTLRDVEIPDVEEGQSVDVEELIAKTERAYIRNLKAAGLDKTDTSRPRNAGRGGGTGKSQADLFFERKAAKEGWKK